MPTQGTCNGEHFLITSTYWNNHAFKRWGCTSSPKGHWFLQKADQRFRENKNRKRWDRKWSRWKERVTPSFSYAYSDTFRGTCSVSYISKGVRGSACSYVTVSYRCRSVLDIFGMSEPRWVANDLLQHRSRSGMVVSSDYTFIPSCPVPPHVHS